MTTAVAFAGIAMLPIQAFAHEGHAHSTKAEVAVAAEAGNRMTVVRDADTGQLRAPTAEEAAALQSSTPAASGRLRVAKPSPLTRYHSSGATGARLTDEFMSYAVMVRQPDGSLAAVCFDSREEADAAAKAQPLLKSNTLPTE